VRVAWFRPRGVSDTCLDDLGTTLAALAETHAIDVVDDTRAHDFVWRQARRPYDVCVFELDDTPAHQYVYPYLLHYPGVLALRTASLHTNRTTALMHQRRRADCEAEMDFSEGPRRTAIGWHVSRGGWPLLRVPLLASRLAVVADDGWREALQRTHPDARIRYAPVGIAAPPIASSAGTASADMTEAPPRNQGPARAMRVAAVDGKAVEVVDRAITRATSPEAPIERLSDADVRQMLSRAAVCTDVAVALGRPALGISVAAALTAMAAGLPTIVAETETTAAWPALDPQSWQPRGYGAGTAPALVSIDPRDEEHSLVLALRRLATDTTLRRALGAGGRAWWAAHHTVAHAETAWNRVLHEAAALAAPPQPADWPAHLTADGTERARAILGELGLDLDAL
jgi:hypothetical protein